MTLSHKRNRLVRLNRPLVGIFDVWCFKNFNFDAEFFIGGQVLGEALLFAQAVIRTFLRDSKPSSENKMLLWIFHRPVCRNRGWLEDLKAVFQTINELECGLEISTPVILNFKILHSSLLKYIYNYTFNHSINALFFTFCNTVGDKLHFKRYRIEIIVILFCFFGNSSTGTFVLQGRAVAGHSAAVLCWRSVSAHFYPLPIRLYSRAQALNLYPVSCILYQFLLSSTSFQSGYTAEHNH